MAAHCVCADIAQLEQLDGRLPNPDQCLTTDIQKFCHSLADLYRCVWWAMRRFAEVWRLLAAKATWPSRRWMWPSTTRSWPTMWAR